MDNQTPKSPKGDLNFVAELLFVIQKKYFELYDIGMICENVNM
jgi:hypothetical protein